MKVMCIKTEWYGVGAYTSMAYPEYGVTYTVLHSGLCPCGECKEQVYAILELDPDVAWLAKYFIPCSEIDETEMVREKEVQCY